jgi:hypothetical protein
VSRDLYMFSRLTLAPAISGLNPTMMWQHIIAGSPASFIGIGLARFAYTPLIPPLIQAHWFSAGHAVYSAC